MLLIKLEKNGFEGLILEILGEYLSDRYQNVCENGNNSNKFCVKRDVSQGSVLASFLSLFYINEIEKTV